MKRVDQHRNSLVRTILLAILALIIFGSAIIYWQAAAPYHDAQQNAVKLAKRYGKLKKTANFYLFNRKQTYFTVAGTNQQNQAVYVMIAQKSAHINIYQQASGISQQQAEKIVKQDQRPKKIMKTALGKWGKTPVWEVTYLNHQGRLSYTLLKFKNGDLVKTIQNL
ncbi:DUF5590 domain-containing protein [Liquorilactobacillus sicerae]|uniref:cell wall elongation regulator TseB-like domain-containing protein n=1 Tax=Liquorilactobacillus sicerae TaxID=1416943 RepID=UPI002480F1A3|nr:DUF5590 domain-containing protein [Liquorilactobacillus sicerae]